MTKRLKVLKESLEKKEKKFDEKLNDHFQDAKSANGQPLNDKRNGRSTLNRWERQNDALRTIKNGIQVTKDAIEREQNKINNVEAVKGILPKSIIDLLEDGTLIQWRKHPMYFFVKGVDRGRIIYKDGHVFVKRHTEIPNQDQYTIFRDVFNSLKEKLQLENTTAS